MNTPTPAIPLIRPVSTPTKATPKADAPSIPGISTMLSSPVLSPAIRGGKFKKITSLSEQDELIERIIFHAEGFLDFPEYPMRSRDDLSFTARSAESVFLNWHIPAEQRAKYWGNGVDRGRMLFEEVRRLAENNPMEAFATLSFAWANMRQTMPGEETGFMEAFARAAIAGILAYPEDIPEVPKSKKAIKQQRQSGAIRVKP